MWYGMPNICFLCASDEGIFLDISEDNTFFNKIETCLSLKASKDDALSTKICHKCAYEVDKCYDFVHKYKDSRKALEKSQTKRKSNCFFCQEAARKGYFFNLKKTNQLNDAFDKIYYLFDELSDETDIFICLVCRYSIDLLFDLKTVSEEVSEKLHKVIDEGIRVEKLAKTRTTIVRRKTTRVRSPRIGLHTTSDTESDSNIMARNSRKAARAASSAAAASKSATADKVERRTRNRFCDECQSETERGVDMYRIHRTGRTVCKTCWMTMDPEKITERNKRKRNTSDAHTKPCKVFVKDVFEDSTENQSKPIGSTHQRRATKKTTADHSDKVTFRITDDNSSGNESRSSTKTKAQLKQLPEIKAPTKRAIEVTSGADDDGDTKSRPKRATREIDPKPEKSADKEGKRRVGRPSRVRKKSESPEPANDKKSATKNRQNSKRDRSSSVESIASSTRSRSTRSVVDVELPKRGARKRNDSVTSVTSVTSVSSRRGARIARNTSPVREFKSPPKPAAKRTKRVARDKSSEPEVTRALKCAVCSCEFESRADYSTHQGTHLRNLEIKLDRVRVPERKIVEPERLSSTAEESDDSIKERKSDESEDFVLHVRNGSDSENKHSAGDKVESETKTRGKMAGPRGKKGKNRDKLANFVKKRDKSPADVESEILVDDGPKNENREQVPENREPVPEIPELVPESVENSGEVREGSANPENESEVPESGSKVPESKEDDSEILKEGSEVPEKGKIPENGSELAEGESEVPEGESKVPDEEPEVPEDEDQEKGEKVAGDKSPKSRKKKSLSRAKSKRQMDDSTQQDLEEDLLKDSAKDSSKDDLSKLEEEDLLKDESSEENAVKSGPQRKSLRKNKSPSKSPAKSESPKVKSTKSRSSDCANASSVDQNSPVADSNDLPAENSKDLPDNAEELADDSKDPSANDAHDLSAVDSKEPADLSRDSLVNLPGDDSSKDESSKDESKAKSPRKDKSPRRKSRRDSSPVKDQDQNQDQDEEDPKGKSAQKERDLQDEENLEDLLRSEELQVIDEVGESTVDPDEEPSMIKENESLEIPTLNSENPEPSSSQVDDEADDKNKHLSPENPDQDHQNQDQDLDPDRDQNLDQDRRENQDRDQDQNRNQDENRDQDQDQNRDQDRNQDQDRDRNQDENKDRDREDESGENRELEAMDEMGGAEVFSGMNPMIAEENEQSLPQEIEDVVQNGLEAIGGEMNRVDDNERETETTKAEDTVSEVLQECFDLATKQKEPEKNVFFASQANLEDISNDALNGGDMPSLETDESEVSNL